MWPQRQETVTKCIERPMCEKADLICYRWLYLLAALHLEWFCQWVFKQNAICWLLREGLVCYIFTVSLMINLSLPHAVLSRSHSGVCHTQGPTSASACSLLSLLFTHYLFLPYTVSVLLFLTLSPDVFHSYFPFSDFLFRINDWNEPYLVSMNILCTFKCG